jgi:hypothetical protein
MRSYVGVTLPAVSQDYLAIVGIFQRRSRMRPKIATVSLVLAWIAFLCGAAACAASSDLAGLARVALQGDLAERDKAVAGLRQAGPAGMAALLAACPDGTCRASQEVFDKVCGVHDCPDLRLFWYTDLEAAKAAAQATGKPILSLRLMGRLDEEFSCANSRFFRTVFYQNATINKLLRDRYVLHWRSVRPVPHVTIDFGDGNRVEQTLTGNSIHYILDANGRVLTPLPGLYGPAAFQRALREGEKSARAAAVLDDGQFAEWAEARYRRELGNLEGAFRGETAKLYAPPPPKVRVRTPVLAQAPVQPAPAAPAPAQALAEDANPLLETEGQTVGEQELQKIPTIRDPWAALQTTPGVLTDRINIGGREASKSASEAPMLARVTDTFADPDEDLISDLARLRRPNVHLDTSSRLFLTRKLGAQDNREDLVIANFERTIARDEVINNYRNLPDILRSLIRSTREKGFDLEAFNLQVYKYVFLTPVDDPWLGLVPEDTYGALPAWTRTLAAKP